MQTSLHSQQRLAILRILLVRHGLSEDNLNSIWAGHKDSPLSNTGILQAKALGASLANSSLSAIYSSDLKRASRTAEEILQVSNRVHYDNDMPCNANQYFWNRQTALFLPHL